MRGRLTSTLPALLLLAAATLAVHAGALRSGFVWDDAFIIVDNPVTTDFSRLGQVLLSPDEMVPYYRPLNRATYLVDYQLFGMSPAAFHAVNLLVHLAGVLLLYLLCRRLFEARWPPLIAAMLLAVHPIHVEAVTFVSARNNLFALAFALAATLLLMRAVDRRSWAFAACSGASFFLALASKEQGAMVLPVLGAWLLISRESRPLRLRGLYLLGPHLLAVGAYAVARSAAIGGPVTGQSIWPGIGERLLRNYYVVPEYVRLMIFPDRLTILHELPKDYLRVWWLPLAWLAIAGGVAALVRRPTPASSFGLLWFAFNLVPALGLLPIPSSTIMAERFVHASTVGLWIVLADVAYRALREAPPRWAWAGAGAIALALGARSAVRGLDWRDDLALHRSAAVTEPRSLVARFDLGVALKDSGDLEGARREWEAALTIAPEDPGTHAQLGTLAAVHGELGEAEAHYRIALRGDPELPEASLNLGKILERTGRRDQAGDYFARVLRAKPPASPEVAAQALAGLQRLGLPAAGQGPRSAAPATASP